MIGGVSLALTVAVLAVLVASLVDARRRLTILEARADRADEFLPVFDVRRCRECRCTDDIACWSGCWWVEEDLCSSCADDAAAAGSSLEDGRR